MRKCLLVLSAFLAVSVSMMARRDTTVTVGTEKLGIHPYKQYRPLSDGYAHWSLSFEGGFDLIDADFVQPRNTIIPKTRVRPTGGISVEYSFTPTWGLALSYMYGNYGLKYKDWNDYTIMGHMHTGMIQLTFDFVDAWFKYRKTDIFSLYGIVGIGMGLYNSDFIAEDGGETKHPRADGKYDMTGVIGVGLAAEFNITRELALGVKGMYNIYTVDRIDAREKGTNNDCMEYLTANIRWKIAGKKRNHMRNFANDDILRAQLAETAEDNREVKKDTVVIIQKDTVVVSRTDTIAVIQREQRQKNTNSMMVAKERTYVYFENDKSELSDQTLNIIQQLAVKLQEDTTLYAEVIGYCDNTGTDEHNSKLGQRRAEAVVNEFVNVYGISRDRFLPIGKGKINNVKSAYSPNRRVEILLTTEEGLNQSREELEKQKANKSGHGNEANAQNVQPTTSANQESASVAEDNDEYLAYVISKKDKTTLSGLAKKYYKNVYCWPYIYEANMDVLKSPDLIPEGITLKIPRLNAKQMDMNNTSSMSTAIALAQQYLKK